MWNKMTTKSGRPGDGGRVWAPRVSDALTPRYIYLLYIYVCMMNFKYPISVRALDQLEIDDASMTLTSRDHGRIWRWYYNFSKLDHSMSHTTTPYPHTTHTQTLTRWRKKKENNDNNDHSIGSIASLPRFKRTLSFDLLNV